MALISGNHPALLAALGPVVGGDVDRIRRVVIDIQAGRAVVVHAERIGDESVVDLVRSLDGISINTHSVGGQ